MNNIFEKKKYYKFDDQALDKVPILSKEIKEITEEIMNNCDNVKNKGYSKQEILIALRKNIDLMYKQREIMKEIRDIVNDFAFCDDNIN